MGRGEGENLGAPYGYGFFGMIRSGPIFAIPSDFCSLLRGAALSLYMGVEPYISIWGAISIVREPTRL